MCQWNLLLDSVQMLLLQILKRKKTKNKNKSLNSLVAIEISLTLANFRLQMLVLQLVQNLQLGVFQNFHESIYDHQGLELQECLWPANRQVLNGDNNVQLDVTAKLKIELFFKNRVIFLQIY